MAGDEGKKVKGDEGSLEEIEGELAQQIWRNYREDLCSSHSVDLCESPRARDPGSYDLVSEEETEAAFVYKMDKPRLTADEVRVEIRWGNALWVIGEGDETIKVKLQKNHKMRLSKATASMSADGVLTVKIPKRFRPRKWHEYKDVAFNKFKTVSVGISWP